MKAVICLSLFVVFTVLSTGNAYKIDFSSVSKARDAAVATFLSALSLDQLVKTAYEHPRYTSVIIDHFLLPKYRFNETTVHIESPDMMYLFIGEEGVELARNHDEILKVLRVLGHIFTSIEFAPESSANDETDEIVEHLNKYCGQAEQQVVIAFADEIISFDVVPLEHVTIVTIEPGVNVTGFPLHTYTPNVQHLTIKSADLPSIAHNFPDLVSFHLETGRDLDQAMLFEFFSLNRQLREVYTTIIRNKSYLKHISEMLPNLEKLTLENELGIDDITDEPIHFPNVQHYTLTFPYVSLSNVYDIYSPIQFEQLQSFNLSVMFDDMVRPKYQPQYTQLATAYKTIDSLKVTVIEFGRLRMSALTQQLPALKTLDLAWQMQLPNTGFEEFLAADTTLDKVIFSLQYPATEYWSLDKFKSQLPAQWAVSNVGEVYKFLEMPITEVTLVRAQ